MLFHQNLIANADDFGLKASVNKAVLNCYQLGYINSTSLMVNQSGFDEAIDIIHSNKVIKNIGVHINLASGKPVSNFSDERYLTSDGYWNLQKIDKKIFFLHLQTSNLFYAEIEAQINRVIKSNVKITHIDSHYHLHTLPCFYQLFLTAAKKYEVKIRLAQTYNEGNFLKFIYRNCLNRKIKKAKSNYSDLFETVSRFISHKGYHVSQLTTEVMLHPDFDNTGKLIDHYSAGEIENWKLLLDQNSLLKQNFINNTN